MRRESTHIPQTLVSVAASFVHFLFIASYTLYDHTERMRSTDQPCFGSVLRWPTRGVWVSVPSVVTRPGLNAFVSGDGVRMTHWQRHCAVRSHRCDGCPSSADFTVALESLRTDTTDTKQNRTDTMTTQGRCSVVMRSSASDDAVIFCNCYDVFVRPTRLRVVVVFGLTTMPRM